MNPTPKDRPRQRQRRRQVKAKSRLPAPSTQSTHPALAPLCRKAGCLLSGPADPAAVVLHRDQGAEPIGTTGFLHALRPAPRGQRGGAALNG